MRGACYDMSGNVLEWVQDPGMTITKVGSQGRVRPGAAEGGPCVLRAARGQRTGWVPRAARFPARPALWGLTGVFAWPGLSLNSLIFFTFPSFWGGSPRLFRFF